MTEPHGGQSCRTHGLYRMDCAEYDLLRMRSGGCCEACGIPKEDAPRAQLYIDHDHTYGMSAVRGLICSHCNTELGVLEKGHNSQLRADRHHRFGPYLRASWHMQIVHWARARDGLLDSPDVELQTLNAQVLRFPTVRQATKLIGCRPTVTTRGVVHPGYVGIRITASYGIGRASCAVALSRSETQQLTLNSIAVAGHGYISLTEARPHLSRLVAAL